MNKLGYSVGGTLTKTKYVSTLAEAKTVGMKIAKQNLWRGKWNALWITVDIRKRESEWSSGKSIMRVYVPVRGSGKSADYILSELKRRHGVKPMVWTKK